MAYVRGNENNKHQPGVALVDSYEEPATGTVIPVRRTPTTSPGFIPGYMTFNFQTSYKLNSEWTLGFRVNNIFDKEYFSAGRLGRNPFSPSIYGAIGPDGYNHNSSDWQTTNFIAPGAPRGAWVSLTYQFDPNK
jgi:outer membrane receptor protein involved in Fe transport